MTTTNERKAPVSTRLRVRLEVWRLRHAKGAAPTCWLMAPRIARKVIAELRPLLKDDDGGVINPQELTVLFGVPVKIEADLPQGAVLRG